MIFTLAENSSPLRKRGVCASHVHDVETFALAFGMQQAASEAFDISRETAKTRQMYGQGASGRTNEPNNGGNRTVVQRKGSSTSRSLRKVSALVGWVSRPV